jgi:SAM-dependent methyltransferase
LNFDATPTLRLQKLPLIGRLIVPKSLRFPENLNYGDIVQGLPVASNSASGVYACHVLEHLALDELRIALCNTLEILKPGGVFRLVVPDLAERARRYVDEVSKVRGDASIAFIRACGIGKVTRNRSLEDRLREQFGNSAHLWMWDELSMRQELAAAGFAQIRRCKFGDSDDEMFSKVEDYHRFVDTSFEPEMIELAMEARRTEIAFDK